MLQVVAYHCLFYKKYRLCKIQLMPISRTCQRQDCLPNGSDILTVRSREIGFRAHKKKPPLSGIQINTEITHNPWLTIIH